jgi:hypothetical protein
MATVTTPMDRAEELVRQMTIDEKVMHLSAVYPMGPLGQDGPIHSQLDAQLVSALGMIGHKTPETIAKSVNAIQRYLVTGTRAWGSGDLPQRGAERRGASFHGLSHVDRAGRDMGSRSRGGDGRPNARNLLMVWICERPPPAPLLPLAGSDSRS